MSRGVSRRAYGAVLLLALSAASSASAAVIVVRATVDESQVVRPEMFQPPVFGTGSPGAGEATLSVDTETRQYRFELVIDGIAPDIVDNNVGPNATGLHVHVAPTDQRGPVILDVHHFARLELPQTNGLTPTATGFSVVVEGEWTQVQGKFDAATTFDDVVDALLSGRAFVAVHTTTNSLFRTGAIRGNFEVVAPARFRRGDCNGDTLVDASDAVFMVEGMFLDGPQPGCLEGCNVNRDLRHDLADPVFLLNAIFRQGPEIPAPFADCGRDPAGLGALSCDSAFCP